MPFSSLSDPVDLARAQAALEAAWTRIAPGIPDGEWESHRTKLAYIVASFAHVALDEDDLTRRALDRYQQQTQRP